MADPMFQFLRIHAHRRGAALDLLAEADRVPSHCPHILSPHPANWRMGSAADVQSSIDKFMREPQEVRSKSGQVHLRKPRKDLRCVMDCVASYPVEMARLLRGTDIEKRTFREWTVKTHNFIEEEFGPHYISSCIHLDETHPHYHFFLVGNATRLHPGLREELVDGRRVGDLEERRRRHRAGLKRFLDRYYEAVSRHFDHLREGGRRTTPRIPNREEYKRLKQSAAGRDELHEIETLPNSRRSRHERQR